jgi:hypothetical protein
MLNLTMQEARIPDSHEMRFVLTALLFLCLLLTLDNASIVTEEDVCLDALGQWDADTRDCKLEVNPGGHNE